jgi:hypothetical protein
MPNFTKPFRITFQHGNEWPDDISKKCAKLYHICSGLALHISPLYPYISAPISTPRTVLSSILMIRLAVMPETAISKPESDAP